MVKKSKEILEYERINLESVIKGNIDDMSLDELKALDYLFNIHKKGMFRKLATQLEREENGAGTKT